MNRLLAAVAVLALLAGAAWLRLSRLENRPMHCDEAVHAIKFRQLLEQREYFYNPYEYHGPTLNYFTLPVAWVCGATSLAEITETHLRLVTALAGIALVALSLGLVRELGPTASITALALAAFSPAMVFFSRYYIQEMLLVLFTFGAMLALWRLHRWAMQASGFRLQASGSEPDAGTANCKLNAQAEPAAHDALAEPAAHDAAISNLKSEISNLPPEATVGLASLDPPYSPPQASSDHRSTGGARPQAYFWSAALGVCVGLMHASKETCVLALAAMALAAAVTMPALWRLGWRRLWPLGLTAIGAGLLVSMAFFSSFGRHPWGIIDSFSTYFHYLGRASGEGSAGRHVGPWWYYFANLFWWQWDGRVLVTELVVGVFALLGAVAAFSGWGVAAAHRPAARFVAVYTLSLLAVYCVLPYKTPWCALGFLHGLILLGGVGAATLLGIVPRWWSKIALVLSAAAFLGWISYRGSFIYQEDPRNPYVYAHTTSDVIPLCQRVRELALSRPEGRDLPVQVIAPDDDYWPLPWYLRDLSAVGYLSEVPRAPLAPIVVLPPDLEPQMLARNYSAPKGQRHLYVPVDPAPGAPDWRLRPRVPLRVYVRHDLFR